MWKEAQDELEGKKTNIRFPTIENLILQQQKGVNTLKN
jgi:hypothetical protein